MSQIKKKHDNYDYQLTSESSHSLEQSNELVCPSVHYSDRRTSSKRTLPIISLYFRIVFVIITRSKSWKKQRKK